MTKPSHALAEPLFERIGHVFRAADDGVVRPPRWLIVHELAYGRLALPLGAARDRESTAAPTCCQFLVGQRLVDALRGEVEIDRLRQQRQLVISSGQPLDERHLVLGLGLCRGGYRVGQMADHIVSGSRPARASALIARSFACPCSTLAVWTSKMPRPSDPRSVCRGRSGRPGSPPGGPEATAAP